jgi:two-component system, sporulation sensor kinase A
MNAVAHHKYYNCIPLPILISNKEGSIIYQNAEATKTFKTNSKETYKVTDFWKLKSNTSIFQEFSFSEEAQNVELVLTTVQNERKMPVRLSFLEDDLVIISSKEISPKAGEGFQDQTNDHQKLNSLTEENPDGIIFVDQNGNITNVNAALQKMIGYSTEEIVHEYKESISFKELERMKHFTTKGLKGTPQVYETSIRHKNGELIYLDVKTIPITVNDKCIGVYLIFRDISGFKKAQSDALEQEEVLRSLINSIPEFVIFQDQQGRILELNQFAKEIFGVNGQDIKGKTYKEIACTEDWKAVTLQEENSGLHNWDQHSKIEFEHSTVEKNGRERTFEVVKAPGFTLNGERKYLISIGRDITQRKRTEEDLIETKELLESIFTNSADGISVINLEAEIVKTNLAFQQLYGYNEKNLPRYMIDLYPPEKKLEAEKIFNTVLQGTEIVDYETLRRHKEGHFVEVSITYSPIKDDHGKVTAISAITRDIGERKRTDELLMRSEKLSAIGQLSAAVAHEVRNPLTSVKGFLQLYHDKINPEILTLMVSELERIEDIITEFLSLAKPQAITYQPTDMTKLIQSTLSLMETQARLKDVVIYTDFALLGTPLQCESNQIKQVLINVIKNGIESMPFGGNLKIKTRVTKNTYILSISDEGVGISEERLKHIGEPFFSNKDSGTGLGLVVCYKIIHEHGGDMKFHSVSGEGTTVTITLPR